MHVYCTYTRMRGLVPITWDWFVFYPAAAAAVAVEDNAAVC